MPCFNDTVAALGSPITVQPFVHCLRCGCPVLGVVVVRRAVRVEDFAFARLPGWPFRSYVWLTIGGLATLGAGLVTGGISVWLGRLTVAVAVLCTAAYVSFKDIPPFVFYILFVVIGVVLL